MTKRPAEHPFPYLDEAIILIAGLVVAFLWLPYRMKFPFDDSFITFRYSDNLAHGLGIVWNAGGPHTEGYTNFLFMLLLSPFRAMGCDLVTVSQCIGVLAVLVTAMALYQVISVNTQRRSIAAWFGVALLYADPFIWFNAYSGLETSMFTMLIVLALWGYVCKRSISVAFVFCLLASLTRPEGVLMAGIIVCIAFFRMEGHTRREVVGSFLIYFVLPVVLYVCWKLYYFGDLLPNSFYVKVAQPNAGHVSPFQGSGTLRIFYRGLWYLVALSCMLFLPPGRRVSRTISVVGLWCIGLSSFYLFSLLLQPQYGRFTNSIEVLLMITASLGLGNAFAFAEARQRVVRPRAAVLMACWIVGYHVYCSYSLRQAYGYITYDTSYEDRYPRIAQVFRAIPHHEAVTLAWSDAGMLPYYSGIRHLDVVGLNTTSIAKAHSTEEALAIIAASAPDMIFVPLDPIRLDSMRSDTCRTIIRWGHGYVGAHYPELMRMPALARYRSIATIPQTVYDLNLMIDTSSVHYQDITSTILPLIGHNPDFEPATRCMK